MSNFLDNFNPDSLKDLDDLYSNLYAKRVYTSGLEFMLSHPDRLIPSKYPELFRSLAEENQRCHRVRFNYKLFRVFLENPDPEKCFHAFVENLPDYFFLALSQMQLEDKMYELAISFWGLSSVLSKCSSNEFNFNMVIRQLYNTATTNPDNKSERSFNKDSTLGIVPRELFISKCYSEDDYNEISKLLYKFDLEHYS